MENEGDRRQRAFARRRFSSSRLVIGVAVGAALVGLAAACLPDLAELPVETTPVPEGAAPFVGCGDGVIATLDDGGDAGESCDPGDARTTSCQNCQLVCEPGGVIDPTSGHCYFLSDKASSYKEATSRCHDVGAHIVTFTSAAEAELVKALVGDAGAAGYWVGLSPIPALGSAYGSSHAEEPGYPAAVGGASGPCPGCFGLGADADIFPLEDAAASDAPCLASHDGTWFQVGCDTGVSRTVLCEREPLGRRAEYCAGPFCFSLVATAATKRYVFFVAPADPEIAAQSCASLDAGLLVLESAEEREQLAHEIVTLDPFSAEQTLWLGLGQDAGTWTWDDGVAATPDAARPLPWGNAEPRASSSTRAYMRLSTNAYDTQLAFADDGGKSARLYVCQRVPQ